jgi:hypothetical protein
MPIDLKPYPGKKYPFVAHADDCAKVMAAAKAVKAKEFRFI